MELFGELPRQYVEFAEDTAGASPCFDAWARAVADDETVLGWISGLPRLKQQPNLVFAAARWHGVPAPGPYAALREALLEDDGAIRATILARSTQTNEVGRLATLTPVLAAVAAQEGRPLALVEAGASAGLCLYPDRYAYRGELADSSVVERRDHGAPLLTCRVTGPAPLPTRLPEVSWRVGVDLHPLDVGDDDAMAWLAMMVWPEQDERRERLRLAVEVARADPPDLRTGDLLDEVPGLVAEAAAYGVPVVFHSAVVAYVDPARRALFASLMSDLVARGACRWVSNEGPRVLPDVAGTGPTMPDGTGQFVLGLDGRAVAWTHGHGAAMTWLTAP